MSVIYTGSGTAGMIFPGSPEKVVAVKKGDAIALPFGIVTWWFNPNDTHLVVLFLGDTSKAHKSGEFTDFQLTGIFNGFTTEFVSRAWDLPQEEVSTILNSHVDSIIVKVEDGIDMPEPLTSSSPGFVLNCEEAAFDVNVESGGRVVVVSSKNLPLVKECGFGGDLVKLDGNAMCSPGFSCDSAFQVTYITKGSGRVQVVGIGGKKVLETSISEGNLFIVPRFFTVSKIADVDGMEWFSIVTTPNPVFCNLAGKSSVLKYLSPQILQASFDVSSVDAKLFSSKKMEEADTFFPPPQN